MHIHKVFYTAKVEMICCHINCTSKINSYFLGGRQTWGCLCKVYDSLPFLNPCLHSQVTQPYPYVLCAEDFSNFTLVIEGQKMEKVPSFLRAFIQLLVSFWVMHLDFPAQMKRSHAFFDKYILKREAPGLFSVRMINLATKLGL